MKVFKFGGASISTIERVQHIPQILRMNPEEKILIVISAMGKTTNALEKVVEAFYSGNQSQALLLFESIKKSHLNLLKYTITQQWQKATDSLQDLFTEVEWLLHDQPVKPYNYYYDQIVCVGELLSSTIMSFYLNEEKLGNQWLDVRDVLRTDSHFREASLDWEVTTRLVHERVAPLFEKTNLVITQGFIACTDDNESTNLGREGSDFSAAIFANLLNAKDATIWKDVDGVMNADPKDFAEAERIPELSYGEVIEMAYYGAQVIHPKTIKPLQNKHIPLLVKSFLDPEGPGTLITSSMKGKLPPVVVYKHRQVLLTLDSKDFSFVEGPLSKYLNEVLESLRIKPNLTQNTAIRLFVCIDEDTQKIEAAAQALDRVFEVQVERGLTLLTIRHYTGVFLEKLTAQKIMVLQQKTQETIQTLMRES